MSSTRRSWSGSASGSRRWCSSAATRGVAMRIGTNHGSLSDRIMNRYGDTPLGMVESALEFARIARELGYHEFVFSMKSSNPKVMIEAYRLLVARLAAGGSGLELSDSPRGHRSGRRRGWADQERDRHRLAAGGRDRRYHARLAHRGQRARDSRGAGAGLFDAAKAAGSTRRRGAAVVRSFCLPAPPDAASANSQA